MTATNTQNTAQFNSRALIRAVLSETANNVFAIPKLKTQLIDRAKAAGAAHRDAQAFATQTIARMQQRAAAAQAKIDAKTSAQRKHAQALIDVARGIADAQKGYMHPTPDTTIIAALYAASIKQDKATVRSVRETLLRIQVRRAFEGTYRTCCNGAIFVKLGKVASVEQAGRTEWDLYRGNYKGWAAHITDTTITVRPDFWLRVTATIDTAIVDGKLVLDAKPARSKLLPEGTKAYKATWIERGRGNQVSAMTGYILVSPVGKSVSVEALDAAAIKRVASAA